MGKIHHVEFPGLGITLDLNTVAFKIGDFAVYWYGVIIGVGFILACIYAIHSCKKMNINSDHLLDGIIVGLIAGVIGARLYYVVFYPGDKYWSDPSQIFNIRDGGLGIYGGIIFALLAALVVAKKHKMSFGAVLDVASLGFLIGQGIGRWANFVNQEAFGANTDLPWGMYSDGTMSYMQNLANQGLNVDPSLPVHPCFLYESLLCLLGFVLLHFFTRYKRRYDGQTFLLYLIWYGVVRFIIEGTRTDSLMLPFVPIKVSQFVAVVSALAAVIVLVKMKNSTKLTGCGDKSVMELNDITFDMVKKVDENADENIEEVNEEISAESTIFTRDYSKKDKIENDDEIENNDEIDDGEDND